MQIIYPRTPLPIALDRYDGCSMDELVGIMSRGSADARSPGPFKQYSVQTAHKKQTV